jgi:hypothetical protein
MAVIAASSQRENSGQSAFSADETGVGGLEKYVRLANWPVDGPDDSADNRGPFAFSWEPSKGTLAKSPVLALAIEKMPVLSENAPLEYPVGSRPKMSGPLR